MKLLEVVIDMDKKDEQIRSLRKKINTIFEVLKKGKVSVDLPTPGMSMNVTYKFIGDKKIVFSEGSDPSTNRFFVEPKLDYDKIIFYINKKELDLKNSNNNIVKENYGIRLMNSVREKFNKYNIGLIIGRHKFDVELI